MTTAILRNRRVVAERFRSLADANRVYQAACSACGTRSRLALLALEAYEHEIKRYQLACHALYLTEGV